MRLYQWLLLSVSVYLGCIGTVCASTENTYTNDIKTFSLPENICAHNTPTPKDHALPKASARILNLSDTLDTGEDDGIVSAPKLSCNNQHLYQLNSDQYQSVYTNAPQNANPTRAPPVTKS